MSAAKEMKAYAAAVPGDDAAKKTASKARRAYVKARAAWREKAGGDFWRSDEPASVRRLRVAWDRARYARDRTEKAMERAGKALLASVATQARSK